MKKSNILKATLMLGVVVAASSCTEEKIYGVDPNGVPQASDYLIKAEVDQEINKVSLSLTDLNGNPATGVYPIWKVYTKANPVQSTRPVYTDIVTIAGDYDVEVQIGNHHGVSDGVKTGSFHIDNTLVDFSPYILFFTNNESKTWQIAANEQGHLGCGTPGTDGLDWWSASPYDKKDWGVYDNRMIFTDNGGNSTGGYTFDPGASGTIYVNTGITDLAPYSAYNTNDGNDYCAPAEVQNTTFTISPEGTDLYLVLPQGTLMAYLPNVELYDNPKWKINDINKNKIELTCDNGGIAWHYILQPEGADAADKPFEGFKYDSEFNLWKDANVSLESTWFSPSDWSGSCVQPDVEVTNELIKFHTPSDMGNDQWQGQVHIATDIQLSAASNYDFSIRISAPVDALVTVKPHKSEGDDKDDVYLTAERASFDAGGSYYYVSDVPGWDGGLTLTLDFAGYPDTDFEVSKVVIKDHANDDGTVLPTDTPDDSSGNDSVSWVDVNSSDNLWNAGNVTEITSWTSPSDWSGSTPEPEITREGNNYTVQYSEAPGPDQWQAQVVLHTDMAFLSDKKYDVRLTINPSCNIAGATVKFTQEDNDDVYWTADRHDLEAYEDNIISLPGLSADLPQLKVVFDFAGVEAGATVVVKDIIIQEHHEFSWEDVDSDANLWSGVTEITSWTSPSDWSGSTPEPEITQEGKTYTVQYSEAPGPDQWQAQVVFHTDQSYSADQAYDLRVTINPSCDIAGATVKFTQEDNDDVYWTADRHDLEAYEDNVVEIKNVSADLPQLKVVFDFAGVEANAKVTIKDIIIQEHK